MIYSFRCRDFDLLAPDYAAREALFDPSSEHPFIATIEALEAGSRVVPGSAWPVPRVPRLREMMRRVLHAESILGGDLSGKASLWSMQTARIGLPVDPPCLLRAAAELDPAWALVRGRAA